MIPLLALVLAVDSITIDVKTRAVVEQHWADANQAIPVGSLVKPFTALAYSGDFPEYTCTGERCWLAGGHGRLKFRRALADSCNEYFLNLARDVNPQTLATVAAKFGIPAPGDDSAETRIGLGREWPIAPVALARAYAELVARSGEPRVREILGIENGGGSGHGERAGGRRDGQNRNCAVCGGASRQRRRVHGGDRAGGGAAKGAAGAGPRSAGRGGGQIGA